MSQRRCDDRVVSRSDTGKGHGWRRAGDLQNPGKARSGLPLEPLEVTVLPRPDFRTADSQNKGVLFVSAGCGIVPAENHTPHPPPRVQSEGVSGRCPQVSRAVLTAQGRAQTFVCKPGPGMEWSPGQACWDNLVLQPGSQETGMCRGD